jgi:hypothetical protein
MSEEEKGFVLKDSEEGGDKSSDGKETEDKTSAEEQPDASQLPEINFSTFIFSLHSSVLLHLGVIEDPGTGQKQKNLPLAKQTIDIIGMLEEKTRGNLTEDEEKLIKHMLHDLRLMYVNEKG